MEIVAGQGAVSFNQIRRPMEDSSSQPFDHDQTAPGASKFLSDLPSRGHLYSTVISSNLSFAGGMRVYICEHILLLQSQHIKTDQQNIRIRSLMLNNNKVGSSSKDVKAAAEGPRKRAAEKVMDSSASAKKANTKNNSQSEGSSSIVAKKDYHSFTVERLRALLKERGLSPKGKKDIIYPNNEEDDAVAEGSRKNDEVKEGLKFASDDIEGEEKKTQEDNKGTARDDGIMKIDGKSCKSMVHGRISKMQAAKK